MLRVRPQLQAQLLQYAQQNNSFFRIQSFGNRLHQTQIAPMPAKGHSSFLGTQNSEQANIPASRVLPNILKTNFKPLKDSISQTWKYQFALPGLPLSKQPTTQSNKLMEREVGLSIFAYMSRGELVPDHVVRKALHIRLSQNDCIERGWVLDGYPRTARQASELMSLPINVRPEVIIEFQMDSATALRRIRGRGIAASTASAASVVHGSSSDLYTAVTCRPDDNDSMVAARRQADYDARRESIMNELSTSGVRIVTIDVNENRSIDHVAADVAHAVKDARRIVLLGRAGCGKSIQGHILQDRNNGNGPIHVSTGALLRHAAQSAQSLPHEMHLAQVVSSTNL